MWINFFRFQLRLQFRQPFFWIVAIASFALAFAQMSSDRADVFPFFNEQVYRNAPIMIVRFHNLWSSFYLLLIPLFFVAPVLRDTEQKVAEILFPMPFQNRDYIIGYFLSGVVSCSCVVLVTSFGIALGLAMPWLDQARIGPMTLWPFAWDFLVMRLPTLYFIGAASILIAVIARSITIVYAFTAIFLFLSGRVVNSFVDSESMRSLLGMLHPFGRAEFFRSIEKFTVQELNTKLPTFSGELLSHRAVQFFITLGLLYCAIRFFDRDQLSTASKPAWTKLLKLNWVRVQSTTLSPERFTDQNKKSFGVFQAAGKVVKTGFGFNRQLWHVWSIFRLEMKMLLWNKAFLGISLIMSLLVFFYIGKSGEMHGLDQYPTTAIMLESVGDMLNVLMLLVVTFLAGELVFRERQNKLAEFVDAFPVKNWTVLTAKLLALFCMIALVLFFCGISVLIRQIQDDEISIEIGALLRGLIVTGVPLFFYATLAFAMQVVVNNKYIAYLGMLLLFSFNQLLRFLGFSQHYYQFGSMPTLPYSDLNGYGHYIIGWIWYAIYWTALSAILIVIANAFWVRGSISERRFTRKSESFKFSKLRLLSLSFLFAVFAGSGIWIYYNTNITNQIPSTSVMDELQVAYEKQYRGYANVPHPKLHGVFAQVDLYPEERRMHIEGKYTLKNETKNALQHLLIQDEAGTRTTWKNLPQHELIAYEKQFGFRVLKLKEPLQANGTITLEFSVDVQKKGFTNDGVSDGLDLVGSFFSSRDFFPHFGYSERFELQNDQTRKKHELGPKTQIPALEDRSAWEINSVDPAAGWITFETIISTDADQLGIAPGNLERHWIKDGRQYAHYKMDQPMMPYFAYLSGKWLVKQDLWKNVPIEIYYDKKHDFNIDRMLSTAKRSLEYYSEQFGPYPYKQLRIAEFPRYHKVAQSFANMIPYSEAMGFTADLRNRENIDFVTFVTAHEVAHQWWGHQFPVAKVQGAAMLTESLAEYSALMVMEKKYGIEKMRRYLSYELDAYFGSRKAEKNYALPLYRVEDQKYLAYTKGSMAFYRLRHEIGEEALNLALRRFLENQVSRGVPYATSADLLKEIRAITPEGKQFIVTDLFEKTIYYDNRIISAKSKRNSAGTWTVEIEVELAKIATDSQGNEFEIAYDEPIQIAIYRNSSAGALKADDALVFEKKLAYDKKSTFQFEVESKPYEVWIDPLGILVERNRGDNRKLIQFY
jgi:ABC-type transport system involved in multi-copper enzyme maturation permease subunit